MNLLIILTSVVLILLELPCFEGGFGFGRGGIVPTHIYSPPPVPSFKIPASRISPSASYPIFSQSHFLPPPVRPSYNPSISSAQFSPPPTRTYNTGPYFNGPINRNSFSPSSVPKNPRIINSRRLFDRFPQSNRPQHFFPSSGPSDLGRSRTPSPKRFPSAPLPDQYTIRPTLKSAAGPEPGTTAVKKLFGGDQSISPTRSRSLSPVLPAAPLPKEFQNIGKKNQPQNKPGQTVPSNGKTPIVEDKVTKVEISPSFYQPRVTDQKQGKSAPNPSEPTPTKLDKTADGGDSSNKPYVPREFSPKSLDSVGKRRQDPRTKSELESSSGVTNSKVTKENKALKIKPLVATGAAALGTSFSISSRTASVKPGNLSPPISRALESPHFPSVPDTINHVKHYSPAMPRPRIKWNPSEALVSVVKRIG